MVSDFFNKQAASLWIILQICSNGTFNISLFFFQPKITKDDVFFIGFRETLLFLKDSVFYFFKLKNLKFFNNQG